MITFNPLYTASRSSQRRSRDSLHVSHSSPELHESGEYGESSHLQVHLEPEEKAFLPMFSKQDSDSIQIKENYLSAEAFEEWGLRGKNYLSSHDRKQYELTLDNKVYRDSLGNLLHGAYLYIMLPNNKLYGCKLGAKRHHSYLSSGLNVKAAGFLYCHYGVIVTISSESGHYKPTFQEMLPALELLASKADYKLTFEDHSALSAKLPNQGVRYFEVSTVNNKITLSELDQDTLKENIHDTMDYAQEVFATITLNTALASNEPSTGPSDAYVGAYEDDGTERDPNSVFLFTETPPEQRYLKLTCLWRLNYNNETSRSLGATKLK
ncbi:MAG: hypothetical protein AB7I18_14385 [Candidatus Berkiella sp.]